ADLDRQAGKDRNPLAAGRLGRRDGLLLVIAFLLPSLAILPFLNPFNRVLGLIVLFLFFTYSSGIRAKSVPVLDVAYHGLCLAILGVMGYTQQRPFDISCLFLSAMIFLFSSVSQIMQEIRDWEHDRKAIVTTVTWLGKRKSLALSLILLLISFGLLMIAPFHGVVPFEYLLLSPLAYFIVSPIIRGMRSEQFHNLMIGQIAFRGPIVMAILLVSFLLLRG
ncbi:MAG: UbiA family prenyltransferase, partial [Candidatus Bathyarchaeia archaeon]